MVLTESTMMPIGTRAPDFTLLDTVSGNTVSLADLQSDKATVVMFICNHCPYVKHVANELTCLANDFETKGVKFIAISANDVDTHPDDSPEKMTQNAAENNYPFPYLYDETQDVAKAYHAACTPDFFVFDSEMKCVYRGRLDDSSPGKDTPVTGKDLRDALNAVLNSEAVSEDQKPSMGCNIKWK